MNAKRWLLITLSSIVSILFINFLFLYISDIYGVSSTPSSKNRVAFQQRFTLVEYMLKNLDKYDTLLFGSSRTQFINPNHIKDKKVYNMTVAEGIPHEHLLLLKLFLKKGMKLKQVVIGLDDFSFQVPFEKHQGIPDTKTHYLATNISKFDFYKTYYFRKPNKLDFAQFKELKKKDIYARHYNIIFNQKEAFENEYAVYEQPKPNSPIYNIPTLYNGNEIKTTINDIKEIADICKKNNIELILFINPMHHTTYDNTNLKLLNEFKNELSYITPYYDFTIPNKISKDNSYWLETSHYTLEVGDMILTRIYDNNTSIKDFGIYVQKKDSK